MQSSDCPSPERRTEILRDYFINACLLAEALEICHPEDQVILPWEARFELPVEEVPQALAA